MSTNDTSRGVAPVPNYVNPTSRGPVILVLICTLVPLATVVVFTRMWVRIRIVRSVWLDDYLIMASLVFTWALAVSMGLIDSRYGLMYHYWDVRPNLLWEWALTAWLDFHFHLMGVALAKISILAFYYRVLSPVWTKSMRWILIISMLVIGTFTLIAVIRVIFTCNPPQMLWLVHMPNFDKALYPEYCKDQGKLRIAVAAFNVCSDLFVTLLPLAFIRRLQINPHQKRALYGLFATGFLIVGASIGRLIGMYSFNTVNTNRLDADLTWRLWPSTLSSLIEVTVTIIVACIPALAPLFRIYRNHGHIHPPPKDQYIGDSKSKSSFIRSFLRRINGRTTASSVPMTDAIQSAPHSEQETTGEKESVQWDTDALRTSSSALHTDMRTTDTTRTGDSMRTGTTLRADNNV